MEIEKESEKNLVWRTHEPRFMASNCHIFPLAKACFSKLALTEGLK